VPLSQEPKKQTAFFTKKKTVAFMIALMPFGFPATLKEEREGGRCTNTPRPIIFSPANRGKYSGSLRGFFEQFGGYRDTVGNRLEHVAHQFDHKFGVLRALSNSCIEAFARQITL
jgi:hypothetical protein